MSGLTRDGTAEPASRDQILRLQRGYGKHYFPGLLTTSRIGNYIRSIHTLLKVPAIHTHSTYSHLGISPPSIFCNNVKKIGRGFHFPSGGDMILIVLAFFEWLVRPGVELPQLVEVGFTETI